MFNRIIRDKIPGIDDLIGLFNDSEEKDQDYLEKEKGKGKEKADRKREAKNSDLTLGDKV